MWGEKKLKGNKHVTQHTMDLEFSGEKIIMGYYSVYQYIAL